MKLLLIDAELSFARRLQAQLRQRGPGAPAKLVHVMDIEHGIDLAGRHSFDGILWAMSSDDPEGELACQQLQLAAAHIPILGLVDDGTSVSEAGWPSQIEDVLVKTEIDPDTLVRRVQVILQRRRWQSRSTSLHRSHITTEAPSRATRQPVHESARLAAYRRTAGGFQSVADRTAGEVASTVRPAGPAAAASIEPTGRGDLNRVTARESNAAEGKPSPRDSKLRVLQVDCDLAYSRLLGLSLSDTMQIQCDVQRVGKLADALECLVQQAYDVILIDPALPDADGIDTLKQLQPYAERAPIFVLTQEENEEQSLASLNCGAEDCHFKGRLDTSLLARSIRLALARRARQDEVFDRQRARASLEGARRAAAALPRVERRQHTRYALTRPLTAIPVLPGGQPMQAHQAEGFTLDVSQGGIGFEIVGLERLPTKRLVVGVEAEDGRLHYAMLEVRYLRAIPGGLRVGGEFAAEDSDVLRTENLIPHIDPQQHRFQSGLAADVLEQWARLGVCRPVIMDRVLVCPECQSIPTFRHGCRICGSARIRQAQLVHHFACAHVDLVDAFEEDGGPLVCPKCRARRLVVGTDFEYLSGPYQCADCQESDAELEVVGQCLACELRFPIGQACEQEIIGYHVHRLDPLALVAQP